MPPYLLPLPAPDPEISLQNILMNVSLGGVHLKEEAADVLFMVVHSASFTFVNWLCNYKHSCAHRTLSLSLLNACLLVSSYLQLVVAFSAQNADGWVWDFGAEVENRKWGCSKEEIRWWMCHSYTMKHPTSCFYLENWYLCFSFYLCSSAPWWSETWPCGVRPVSVPFTWSVFCTMSTCTTL